jgi:hypothetical protein
MEHKFTEKQKKYFEPVLEWLDAGGKHVASFDMRRWFSSDGCGTAMCIGGALTQFNDDLRGFLEGGEIEEVMSVPKDFFDVLFYPGDMKRGEEESGDYEEADKLPEYFEVTPQWAAATIRDMLDTGEINWMRNKP